jgi:DNA-binding IclR family transcriptional regulator
MAEKLKSSRTAGGKRRYSAPALEKGLDVLELLSREEDGLTVSSIAKELGRSVSELFRMMVVLEQRGYIHSSLGSDRYRLTLKLFEIAHRFRPMQRLTSVATSIMKTLAYRLEQSCHLVIYYEGKGHVVAQQDAPSERVFSVRLGAEAPLLNTCSGHVLLAFADEHEREIMVGKIPRHHPRPVRRDLDRIILRVREQGCEVIPSAQVQGVTDVGYPVFDHTGGCIAALVVPFFSYIDGSHSADLKTAQLSARDAAGAISRMLGSAPGSSAQI